MRRRRAAIEHRPRRRRDRFRISPRPPRLRYEPQLPVGAPLESRRIVWTTNVRHPAIFAMSRILAALGHNARRGADSPASRRRRDVA